MSRHVKLHVRTKIEMRECYYGGSCNGKINVVAKHYTGVGAKVDLLHKPGM